LKAYHSIQAWFPFIFGLFKKLMHTLQNNVHMLEFPYFVMGSFTLGPMAQATLVSMKEGSLFCFVWFVLMRSTELECFRLRSWSFGKALEEKGCSGLVAHANSILIHESMNMNLSFHNALLQYSLTRCVKRELKV
jgi:hypothetical protein